MEIQNLYITSIVSFLQHLPSLPAKKSRNKAKFIKMCDVQLKQIQEDIQEIAKDFIECDENDKPKQDEHSQFIWKDYAGYKREETILLNEYWVIDELDSLKAILLGLREIVLNYDGEIDPKHELAFDALCDALESLGYEE